jgi:hypothetical protein
LPKRKRWRGMDTEDTVSPWLNHTAQITS